MQERTVWVIKKQGLFFPAYFVPDFGVIKKQGLWKLCPNMQESLVIKKQGLWKKLGVKLGWFPLTRTTLRQVLLGRTLFDAFPTSMHLGDACIVSVTSGA